MKYKVCCECGRLGARGFTSRLMGRNIGKPVCVNVRACDDRAYKRDYQSDRK
jgi:hypothetical protein